MLKRCTSVERSGAFDSVQPSATPQGVPKGGPGSAVGHVTPAASAYDQQTHTQIRTDRTTHPNIRCALTHVREGEEELPGQQIFTSAETGGETGSKVSGMSEMSDRWEEQGHRGWVAQRHLKTRLF